MVLPDRRWKVTEEFLCFYGSVYSITSFSLKALSCVSGYSPDVLDANHLMVQKFPGVLNIIDFSWNFVRPKHTSSFTRAAGRCWPHTLTLSVGDCWLISYLLKSPESYREWNISLEQNKLLGTDWFSQILPSGSISKTERTMNLDTFRTFWYHSRDLSYCWLNLAENQKQHRPAV